MDAAGVTPCVFAERIGTKTVTGTSTSGSGREYEWSADRPEYRLTDGREVVGQRDLPPGAVYFASILADFLCPHEPTCAEHLHAICPNGQHWDVDSRASNCTLPDDKQHHCWVRHGDPRQPTTLHVDKAGLTCAAGAGSIQAGNYHGFLHNGSFT